MIINPFNDLSEFAKKALLGIRDELLYHCEYGSAEYTKLIEFIEDNFMVEGEMGLEIRVRLVEKEISKKGYKHYHFYRSIPKKTIQFCDKNDIQWITIVDELNKYPYSLFIKSSGREFDELNAFGHQRTETFKKLEQYGWLCTDIKSIKNVPAYIKTDCAKMAQKILEINNQNPTSLYATPGGVSVRGVFGLRESLDAWIKEHGIEFYCLYDNDTICFKYKKNLLNFIMEWT
jgi:hypothetical protein